MNESGFITKKVEDMIADMRDRYDKLGFIFVRDGSRKIQEIYEAASEYSKLKEELVGLMAEAKVNGIDVPETKKLYFMAEILFKRGDYVEAYAKLKEASTSFLLETKGEFKILYYIKNNPVQSLGILISLSLVSIGSALLIRLRLLKRKLRLLAEEEELLLQLMRVVQRDCFEGNRMSMEEYAEAMYQYETRLSDIIKEKVQAETSLANLMKIGGKKKALNQERDRLLVLIKQTQDDYLNRGKLDTRVYENMLKTYASRLNKIEEQLVFMEAQEAIRKVSGFWGRWF